MAYNALIIWFTKIFQLVPQLIMVPFLLHRIGDTGYGTYALIWPLMQSIDQLEQSLQSGVIKYSAAYLAEKRIDDVNKVFSTSSIYSISLAVLASAGILTWAMISDNSLGEIKFSLIIIGVMVLLIVPLTPYIAIIQARQRYYVGAIAGTISIFVSLILIIIWFNLFGPSVVAVIVIMAATLFFSRIAQIPVAYRLVPGLRNRPSLFDWGSFRLIFFFGGITVIAALCTIVNTTGVRWLMGTLISTSFIAHLAIMLMPGSLLAQIVQAMTLTVMPATSAYDAVGNQFMLKELLIRGIRYSFILIMACIIPAIVMTRQVLRIWVGAEYEFLTIFTIVIFSGYAFLLSSSTVHHMLKGMGKLRITMINALVGFVIVPISVILGVFFIWRNPYIAVTAGLVAGNLVYGIMQIGFGIIAVQARFREVLVRAYSQPLLVALIVCAVTVGSVTLGGIESVLGRAVVSMIAVLLFFFGCYVFISTTAERRQFRDLTQTMLSRMRAFRRRLPGS